MHMHVDQAGHQRLVSQIDRDSARWMPYRCAGFGNAPPLDQYFARSEESSAFDIQQPRGVQYHRRTLLSEHRARRHNDQDWQPLHALTPRLASSSTSSTSAWYCFSSCALAASKRMTSTGWVLDARSRPQP